MDCKKREKSVHIVDIKIHKIEVQEEALHIAGVFGSLAGFYSEGFVK